MMQDGGEGDGKLDVSSTTRSYHLTDSAMGGFTADGLSSFPFASASSLNSGLFSSSNAGPPLAVDMSTTVIIYEDADEAGGEAEAVQPSSQVPVAFPTWDEEPDYGGSHHISVTSAGFIPVSFAYSASGTAQQQQLAALSAGSSGSSGSGLSSTLRRPPPLPELPSQWSSRTLPSSAAAVPASSVSLFNRIPLSPPPPPPRPSESAVAEEQRRALQPPLRQSPGLPPLPPSAPSATRRTPPSPLSPHPLALPQAVNGSSASSSSLSSSSASALRRGGGGGSLRTASFDVLRYLQSDLHRGELCWLWAGSRQPLERKRQFVFWEPPDDVETASKQQLGSLHWCDAAVLGQQQQRLLLPDRRFLLHDVSDVYVSSLSGCASSPFFLSGGQPAAGVSLPCCVSLLVSESFGFHLQLDSVAQREAWVMEFLALLHERKYITETASTAFASSAAGTASAPLTPISASLTSSQGQQDSDSGSSAPPSVTSAASGSVVYSGVPVSEQPLIASDSIICESASRSLLVSAGDVVVQMDDMDGVFQTRRIQPLVTDGSLPTAMCCHSSCLFQCRRHPSSGRNELIAIPIAADEWRPEALSSVAIGSTAGSHCACSSDGRLVYVAAGSAVLRVADMQRVERLELPQPARGDAAVELGNLALSADDSALFSLDLADPAGSLWWWNVSTGQCRKVLLAAVVSSPRSLAFVGGTCHLLLVNADARVQLLDLTAVIRSPTAATPTLRRIPLDLADVRHCMIGGFSLLSTDEAASGAYTAEDRRRPVLIARAVDSTQGLTTFILPLRGALGIRRWQLVADKRSGGGSSSNLAASLSSARAASTSPRHANGAAAAPPPSRLPRLVLGSSCRLKQLESCRAVCSFVDPSIHFLLLYSHKKRCLYAFNCRTEQLHKMADRLQEDVCALCYEPVRERLYVCWPSRVSYFSIRKADWAELVERKTLQLSGGTTLAHLTARPVSCVCDRAGEFLYVSLSVRVVRVSAAGDGIRQDFTALGSLVCDPRMADLALSHGDRQLLALDSATRRVWRWEISSGQCLNRLTDRAYLSMDRSDSSPPACRLSVAHPNSSIILLADTAAQLRVFAAPPFDASQPQQCSELMRLSLLTSVEPSSRSWRLTSPFSSSAADDDGSGGSQALIAPDALFARSMRDESISVVAVQTGLRLISQFRREEQQSA